LSENWKLAWIALGGSKVLYVDCNYAILFRVRPNKDVKPPAKSNRQHEGSGMGVWDGVMLPPTIVSCGVGTGATTEGNTLPSKVTPPVKPSSVDGVVVVVKAKTNESPVASMLLLVFATTKIQFDVAIESTTNVSDASTLKKEFTPGIVRSTAVIPPLVTSSVSVPENEQIALGAQEPRNPPDAFVAVPDTSNGVIASACAWGAQTTTINTARMSRKPVGLKFIGVLLQVLDDARRAEHTTFVTHC
jgi:hypothetical protein